MIILDNIFSEKISQLSKYRTIQISVPLIDISN
jgi:hypothetical protein